MAGEAGTGPDIHPNGDAGGATALRLAGRLRRLPGLSQWLLSHPRVGGNSHWLRGPKKKPATTEWRDKDMEKGALDTTTGGERRQRTVEHGEGDEDGVGRQDDPPSRRGGW